MTDSTSIQKGYLLIADLSGYTPFVHQTEMEHAQAITQELIAIILDHVRAPFRLVQMEGDAVFIMHRVI
jgi:hypothetical protein